MSRNPIAWAARRAFRRALFALKKWRANRKRTTTGPKRRATNRGQLRCRACRLYIRELCTEPVKPCRVCPDCCPGHPEEAQR